VLIDREGVISAKNLHGDELREAIESLLSESGHFKVSITKRAGACATGSLFGFEFVCPYDLTTSPFHPQDHFAFPGIVGDDGHCLVLVPRFTGRVKDRLDI
jgi:hypothetical protein